MTRSKLRSADDPQTIATMKVTGRSCGSTTCQSSATARRRPRAPRRSTSRAHGGEAREVKDRAVRGLRPQPADDHGEDGPVLAVERARPGRGPARPRIAFSSPKRAVEEPAEDQPDHHLADDEGQEEQRADQRACRAPPGRGTAPAPARHRRQHVEASQQQVVAQAPCRTRGRRTARGSWRGRQPASRPDAVPVVERQAQAGDDRVEDEHGEEQAGRRQQHDAEPPADRAPPAAARSRAVRSPSADRRPGRRRLP